MITADELNKAASKALGFQPTAVNYTAAAKPQTTADFFAGVSSSQAAPGMIAAFNASNAMAGSDQSATSINITDRFNQAQVEDKNEDNRRQAVGLGLDAYKSVVEPLYTAAAGGVNPVPRYGFAKSGVIPGKIDMTVADDITINAKKGEYVLSVEDVALLGGAAKVDQMVKGIRAKAGLPTATGAKRAGEPDNFGRMDKGFANAGVVRKERELYPGLAEESAAPYTGFGSKVSGLMRGSMNDLARGFVGDLSAPVATDAEAVRQMLGGGIGQSNTSNVKTPIVSLNLSGAESKSIPAPTVVTPPVAAAAAPKRLGVNDLTRLSDGSLPTPRRPKSVIDFINEEGGGYGAAVPKDTVKFEGGGTGFIRDESTGKMYQLGRDTATGAAIYQNPEGVRKNLGVPDAGFGVSPELFARIAAGNMTEREKFTAQQTATKEAKLEQIAAAADERRRTQAEALKEKRMTTIATAADPAAAMENLDALEQGKLPVDVAANKSELFRIGLKDTPRKAFKIYVKPEYKAKVAQIMEEQPQTTQAELQAVIDAWDSKKSEKR